MNEELIFITSNADTTGNVIPLLHQIRHALSQLLAQQEETTIDLRRLPLSASEESQLELPIKPKRTPKTTPHALGQPE